MLLWVFYRMIWSGNKKFSRLSLGRGASRERRSHPILLVILLYFVLGNFKRGVIFHVLRCLLRFGRSTRRNRVIFYVAKMTHFSTYTKISGCLPQSSVLMCLRVVLPSMTMVVFFWRWSYLDGVVLSFGRHMGSYKDEEMEIYGIKYLYLQDIEHIL